MEPWPHCPARKPPISQLVDTVFPEALEFRLREGNPCVTFHACLQGMKMTLRSLQRPCAGVGSADYRWYHVWESKLVPQRSIVR